MPHFSLLIRYSLPFVFLAVLGAITPAHGQQKSKTELAIAVIERMDKNGDGQLSAEEIPPQARKSVADMARKAGLSSRDSLSVKKLRRVLEKERRKTERNEGREGSDKREPADDSKSSIGSFGKTKTATASRGFGAGSSEGTSASGASGSSRTGRGKKTTGVSAKERDRVQKYARSLFSKNDKNKNKILDKDEWDKRKWPGADVNKDERLTLDELTNYLNNYSKNKAKPKTVAKATEPTRSSRDRGRDRGRDRDRRDRERSSRSDRSSRRSSSSSSDKDKLPTYRFLSPTERLPKGLPDWFLRNDADGDGQIAMFEFTTKWTKAKAEEFSGYDLNNDGIVTPREALASDDDK